MKRLESAAGKIDNCLMTVVRYAAILLLIFNAYVILDTFYISRSAFTSYDLLQYKPGTDTEGNGIKGFADLIKLNSDAAGWITIYDTHIDYPVVQGHDNFEYANKNVFGESALTGSIYLDSGADAFHDWCSIIYGHHMENGAMFGDIDKYNSDDFLKNHNDGYLQTPEGNYRLTVFACAATDAYEDQIYHYTESPSDSPAQIKEKRTDLAGYIKSHALCTCGDYLDKNLENVDKLILLSTCESGATLGRLVLFANAVPGAGRPEKPAKPTVLTAIGHFSGSGHWSLLNLLCVIAVLLCLADSITGKNKKVRSIILETVLLAASVLIYMLTQNITGAMTVSDKYTAVMFVIMIAAFAYDYSVYRERSRING